MNKINIAKQIIIGLIFSLVITSCSDFLGTIPKGEKIPQTYADYNAFIKYYENHYFDNMQQICLLNDLFKTDANLNSAELIRINYMWDEAADRKVQDNNPMLSSNASPYNYGYQAISHWNLIIEDADNLTECTAAQKAMIKAQAKVLRAMTYFHLTNYFADQYTKDKAATTLSIPLITSASVEAQSPQVTIEEMYKFILSDLDEASFSALPLLGETPFHPTKGAGYAISARVYLQMGDYDNALIYADKALAVNEKLYDWRPYYAANKANYDDPDNYTAGYPYVNLENPENYVFAFSSMASYAYSLSGTTFALPIERAERFEKGDLRLITKWKYRAYSTGNKYTGIRDDNFNGGGLTTPEMYYIKAECLARKNDLSGAMALVNKVRETRILAADYKPLSATSFEEAIKYIRTDKENEYLQTAIPFWEMRRFNKDARFATTLSKEYKGVTYTLKPDSHLWIMPFAESVVNNPGNNNIQQNTVR